MMNLPVGSVPAVFLFNRQRNVRLDLKCLEELAGLLAVRCLEHPGPGDALLGQLCEVEISVVSDRVIAQVHRRFLNVPGATDVITFGHGEIVLSATTAYRASRENGEELEREVARYMVHGLLHLNGHEDAEPVHAAAMWQAQESVLNTSWPLATAEESPQA